MFQLIYTLALWTFLVIVGGNILNQKQLKTIMRIQTKLNKQAKNQNSGSLLASLLTWKQSS